MKRRRQKKKEEDLGPCVREMQCFVRAGPLGLDTLQRCYKNILRHFGVSEKQTYNIFRALGLFLDETGKLVPRCKRAREEMFGGFI